MNKIFFILITVLYTHPGYSQSGKVYDNLSLPSKILKGERKYAVYLPPDYETSERSYPVLYLLHGYGDDQTGWIQFGEVNRIADNAIHTGLATSMIIVMPDANTGQPGYYNSLDGKWRYEDFFFEEFIPFIENKYRIKKEQRFRAIAGLSMGGGGTTIYALHHPDMFSSACPLSAYLHPFNIEKWREIEADSNAESIKEKHKKYMDRHDPLVLVKNMSKENKEKVSWYIDCGDDDFLFERNSLLHIAMTNNKVPHEYRVRDGAHNWTYWREALPEVLRFVSREFHSY